jgi:hypothetical protein
MAAGGFRLLRERLHGVVAGFFCLRLRAERLALGQALARALRRVPRLLPRWAGTRVVARSPSASMRCRRSCAFSRRTMPLRLPAAAASADVNSCRGTSPSVGRSPDAEEAYCKRALSETPTAT